MPNESLRPLLPAIARRRRLLGALPVAAAAGFLAGCSDPPSVGWAGYAEGDYLYIAAPFAGRVEQLGVQAGQQVAAGAVLFALDSTPERDAEREASARLKAAEAQAANIQTGKRPDEIAVLGAQLAQAQTQAKLAQSNLARQQQLVDQGFVSKTTLDTLQATLAQSNARVTELQAALRVAKLPARTDERAAAQAQSEAAGDVLRQTSWRAAQKQQTAPAAAQVSDVYFRPGEYVQAGQPVVSLLPPANIKARFFVPQAEVATLSAGQSVLLQCDGCGAPIAARISRIATQSEYTPPVIYSNSQRAKLVFMVEAWPSAADAPRLRPGQPLDVRKAS